jgi:heptosyltransferase-1
MKKVLLVKITSMGDLIQTLPALTDAAIALPGIKFDWLAEESFQEIPKLHPSVDRVIILPYRRWKKNIRQAIKSGEINCFLQQLRHQQYDMVLDAQSNLKSAFVSLLAKGVRYGLDKKSVREYGAHFAYHKKIHISRMQNHTERLRQMFSIFLGYEQPKAPANYGINQNNLPILDFDLPKKFIFVTPIASCDNKLWPEPFWHELIQDIVQSGYDVVMPWWSIKEKERVLRLQNNNPSIHLLPTLKLSQKATVLSRAAASISLDTGLAHMAAALNIPNVCLYGPSNPEHCGTVGNKQIHLRAKFPSCAPCISTKCTYKGESQYHPACLETISPKDVLSSFYALLNN